MPASPFQGSSQALRRAWRTLGVADRVALMVVALAGGWWSANRLGAALAVPGVLSFLFFLAAAFLLLRFLAWWRTRLLWSLRNRLIVAYLFIAVVPVLLLLTLAVLAAQILYSQLGAYLLYDGLRHRVEMLEDAADHVAAAEAALADSRLTDAAEAAQAAQMHATRDKDLPGLVIDFRAEPELLRRVAPPGKHSFAGIVQEQGRLSLFAVRAVETHRGEQTIALKAPLSPELLDDVAPELGSVQLIVAQRAQTDDPPGIRYTFEGVQYRATGRISAPKRTLPPRSSWLDFPVSGISKLDAVFLGAGPGERTRQPVFGVFTARSSRLNQRIFSSLGELGDLYFVLFEAVGVVFLLIEIAALVTGIVLTRTITKAVAELYRATQYVQAGELSHRVRIERRDQLGVLRESFNLMTNSIGTLIEEQKQRQRLENELSIAREVQAQLFPRVLPVVPGVQMEAICRAARVVSGDYYDFLPLGPTQLGIAIADISGKGISAALLMASLQAALRSQALPPGAADESTAEIMSRLNRHMTLHSGDDRFATFFYAVYDSATRTLRYTNAGHLPAFCIADGQVHRLETGGMVLGVVEDFSYEQATLPIEPGSLLVAYSDGLVEPENVYGEEFGIQRLQDTAARLRAAAPRAVAESLMRAVEEWAGTPEQADDMTVIVARLG